MKQLRNSMKECHIQSLMKNNGTRITQLRGFHMLLNGIRTALPMTYALIREISSVPCMDTTAAIQGRKLMLRSPEINQLDLLEEQSRGRIARQSSSSPREQFSSKHSRHPGRREERILALMMITRRTEIQHCWM